MPPAMPTASGSDPPAPPPALTDGPTDETTTPLPEEQAPTERTEAEAAEAEAPAAPVQVSEAVEVSTDVAEETESATPAPPESGEDSEYGISVPSTHADLAAESQTGKDADAEEPASINQEQASSDLGSVAPEGEDELLEVAGMSDREEWLSMGKKMESEAEKRQRLAVESEIKMEVAHAAEVLQREERAIHHDAFAYYEGDFMRMKVRKVLGLNSSTVVLCFAPLSGQTKQGGACRAGRLSLDKTSSDSVRAVEDGRRADVKKSEAELFDSLLPPLPWGEPLPFLEQTEVGEHLELARMGDNRFLICFEQGPASLVSCRLGTVLPGPDYARLSFSDSLDLSPGRLVAASAASRGRAFAVCSQEPSLNSKASDISCRWGAVDSQEGTLSWNKESPVSFAFDDR